MVRSEKGEYIPDVFDDELFVVIDDGKNKVLLSGCTHHGIDNVLRYFAENRGIAGFDLVLGGLHLSGADPAEIKRQIEACKRYDIDKWALNHCTGDVAFELWKKAFGNGVSTASGGEIFQFS